MLDTAYATRNTDGSLQSRIQEYLNILAEYNAIQSTKQTEANTELRDLIGSDEDIQQAENILSNSLVHMVDAISQDDLKEALKLGYINEDQAWELSRVKEKTHAKTQADNKTKSRSRHS